MWETKEFARNIVVFALWLASKISTLSRCSYIQDLSLVPFIYLGHESTLEFI